jgi:NADH:ubiquinone oxidoreductase subunit|tara:strand:- start:993 stop:1361 length:369 start_codon:yes stop_codon:yes gene_type:complete
MKNFLKQIFTWWHKQTIGTLIQTLLTGQLVGSDEYGNKYYTNSKLKRWVIYKNDIESTKIPPEWHLWIHSQKNNIPSGKIIKYDWQKKHKENLTGTIDAHKPEGSLISDLKKDDKKYETWSS